MANLFDAAILQTLTGDDMNRYADRLGVGGSACVVARVDNQRPPNIQPTHGRIGARLLQCNFALLWHIVDHLVVVIPEDKRRRLRTLTDNAR